MNELLQKHGCSNVFTVPEGLKELMADITREVLREQPPKIFDFIANYLSVLLITREHGILAVKILDDLCDCRPSVSENLLQLGLECSQAEDLAHVIKEEIEGFEPVEGKEKVKEIQILKKILTKAVLDEEMSAKVCQVARNAFRDYWYRKMLMQKGLNVHPEEPWEIAAERTLELYKKTKPSFSDLARATQKIQAAYRGYHVRRNVLRHLKPKPNKTDPKVELLGPPIDIAASREIDLGPVINISVREDDVSGMFDDHIGEKLGLKYDPMRTITHIEDDREFLDDQMGTAASRTSRVHSRMVGLSASAKSVASIRSVASAKSVVSAKSMASAKSLGSFPEQSKQSEARQSRLPSQMQSKFEGVSRQSRLASQVPEGDEISLHRISFAEVPPEFINAEYGAESEANEVPEEAGADTIESAEADVPEEIPETDYRTEGDGESAPTASVPSSAPDTANTTDVEDAGEDIEEEG